MTVIEAVKVIADKLALSEEESTKIFLKAVAGNEIQDISEDSQIEQWLNERFLPNCVVIDEDGYAQMCIDALKIVGKTAATDFGGARQRDLGQLWADMTRGYLGEYAFKLFLKQKWDIDSKLGHEAGSLEEYLPTDIHEIIKPGEEPRTPNVKIGIKTTKWNGIWFDIPGEQFDHSDIHILIKVGTGRDHLFAYFKKISVFKDKILKKGKDTGLLSQEESDTIFDKLPTFSPIHAYICGFVRKTAKYKNLAYTGSKGRKNYTIETWNGPIKTGDLEQIIKDEKITGSIKFEGIGSFAHDNGYLFNTGNLLWKKTDWDAVITDF